MGVLYSATNFQGMFNLMNVRPLCACRMCQCCLGCSPCLAVLALTLSRRPDTGVLFAGAPDCWI